MGLIKAAKDAIGSMMEDQWREYFYCEALPDDILVTRGKKRASGRSNSNKGSDNIISNGSIIAVNEGQCMIIVDQGGIAELCADAGEFVYDSSTEPTVFYGNLGDSVMNTFKTMVKRFSFGGNTAKDQRVYFFNTKEIMGNLFGTANPIPFRVVDTNIGLDVDIAVRCHGEYSFRLVDPLLFYKNVCGNVTEEYNRSKIQGQMKSELLTALQPAFAKISAMGVRYSAVPAHSMELAGALNEELSELWGRLRGIEIVTLNLNSVRASEEDEKMIKEMQKKAILRDPGMAAATLTEAQAEAMKMAASNQTVMPMMAFGNMNMASQMGGLNAGQLFQMSAQNQAGTDGMNMGFGMNTQGGMQGMAQGGMQGAAMGGAPRAESGRAPVLGWTCQCGHQDNKGKFCAECGAPKPAGAGWSCSCGTVNQGKFCMECGAKKPQGAPLYKCDKCGWEPEDPAHPPRFCPECGDIFDENDRV